MLCGTCRIESTIPARDFLEEVKGGLDSWFRAYRVELEAAYKYDVSHSVNSFRLLHSKP